jgi:hypothetical protein
MALGSGSAKRVLIAIPPPAATLQAARGLVGLAGADSQAASVPAFLRSSVSMIDRGLSTFESAPGRCAGGGFQACYEIISGVGGWSESRPESQSTPLGKMSNPGSQAASQRPAPTPATSCAPAYCRSQSLDCVGERPAWGAARLTPCPVQRCCRLDLASRPPSRWSRLPHGCCSSGRRRGPSNAMATGARSNWETLTRMSIIPVA